MNAVHAKCVTENLISAKGWEAIWIDAVRISLALPVNSKSYIRANQYLVHKWMEREVLCVA